MYITAMTIDQYRWYMYTVHVGVSYIVHVCTSSVQVHPSFSACTHTLYMYIHVHVYVYVLKKLLCVSTCMCNCYVEKLVLILCMSQMWRDPLCLTLRKNMWQVVLVLYPFPNVHSHKWHLVHGTMHLSPTLLPTQPGGLSWSAGKTWSVWDDRLWQSAQERPGEVQEPPHQEVRRFLQEKITDNQELNYDTVLHIGSHMAENLKILQHYFLNEWYNICSHNPRPLLLDLFYEDVVLLSPFTVAILYLSLPLSQVASRGTEYLLSGEQTEADSPGAPGQFLWWGCCNDDQPTARDGSGQHFRLPSRLLPRQGSH